MAFVCERFESKVRMGRPDECWEWQACVDDCGYGRFAIGNREWDRAHRIAFRWFYEREIADGKEIMHTCDNPPCVNPAHLKQATHVDNMRDCYDKGRNHLVTPTLEQLAKQRANTPRGDSHPRRRREERLRYLGEASHLSKLTWDQVGEIRCLRNEARWTLQRIADRFQIWPQHVSLIARGLVWHEDGYERRKNRPSPPVYQARPLTVPKRGHRGETNPRARLTWKIVREMRRLRTAEGLTQQAIADRFNVNRTHVSRILLQRIWKEPDAF